MHDCLEMGRRAASAKAAVVKEKKDVEPEYNIAELSVLEFYLTKYEVI